MKEFVNNLRNISTKIHYMCMRKKLMRFWNFSFWYSKNRDKIASNERYSALVRRIWAVLVSMQIFEFPFLEILVEIPRKWAKKLMKWSCNRHERSSFLSYESAIRLIKCVFISTFWILKAKITKATHFFSRAHVMGFYSLMP